MIASQVSLPFPVGVEPLTFETARYQVVAKIYFSTSDGGWDSDCGDFHYFNDYAEVKALLEAEDELCERYHYEVYDKVTHRHIQSFQPGSEVYSEEYLARLERDWEAKTKFANC